MADFLVRHFIKDYEDVDKASVRTAYGMLASVVGIICNMVLFMAKFLIGIFLNSVSVTADAFNNLSDAASSVISFIGVKMAGKPADKEHPFGHGRIEYIAALIVSFLVIEVGITFLKESVGKITTPENLNFQVVSVVILLLSIGVKLWMGIFNRRLGFYGRSGHHGSHNRFSGLFCTHWSQYRRSCGALCGGGCNLGGRGNCQRYIGAIDRPGH